MASVLNKTQVNKVWASDITFIPTQEGWLYLAVIINWAFPIYMLGKLSAGLWINA